MVRTSHIIAILCLSIGACLSPLAKAGPKPSHKFHSILINGFAFVPETLTVSVGDKVTWKNKDVVPHTATGQGFDSKSLDEGKSWSFIVKKRGTFHYGCRFHPTMKAILIVK